MTTQLEQAARQALEALEEFCEMQTMLRPIERRDILRAALEQPAQDEPVGEVLNERGEVDWLSFVPTKGTLLYTHAQKREWKGLTEEEEHECWVKAHTEGIDSNWIDTDLLLELREAKLKGKNQ